MITRPLILLVILTITLPARGELQLKGIMVSEGQPYFSVYSTEDQTSKWIPLGQSFAGFKATEFDAVSDTLTLQNGEMRRNLKLQPSTIKVSNEDRKAMLAAQQNAVVKELMELSARLVRLRSEQLQRSDPKIAEEIAALTQRRAELDVTAREIDRALLPQAGTSFVQKLTPPPQLSQ